MLAAICYELDQPVRVEEVDLDAPKRGEVLVRMAASGVCHSDYSVTTGVMPARLPCVLGHEGAGTVGLPCYSSRKAGERYGDWTVPYRRRIGAS